MAIFINPSLRIAQIENPYVPETMNPHRPVWNLNNIIGKTLAGMFRGNHHRRHGYSEQENYYNQSGYYNRYNGGGAQESYYDQNGYHTIDRYRQGNNYYETDRNYGTMGDYSEQNIYSDGYTHYEKDNYRDRFGNLLSTTQYSRPEYGSPEPPYIRYQRSMSMNGSIFR